jgi:hypothetical protein
MKKGISLMSIILTLTLLISTFSGTMAYAAETEPTTIKFRYGFDTLQTVELNTMSDYMAELSDPALTLTAQSSDESVLKVDLQAYDEGVYEFTLQAYKDGEATITFTASDGMSVSRKITVEGTGERTYTISSDITDDFLIAKGNSDIIKLHYTSTDQTNITSPFLIAGDQEKTIATTLINVDEDNNDYYYRLDAVGDVGSKAVLYMGGSGYIPEKLCTVTVGEDVDIRLDTTSEYVCNIGDTYRFVAYTTSGTAPDVSTYDNRISVTYVGKVTRGYEYRIKALKEGGSLVKVRQYDEVATFPVSVNFEATEPYVSSDAPDEISLEQGASYTYKVSIMGGGEPQFVAGESGGLSTQIVKKEGMDYYCKVTATGKVNTVSELHVIFPDSGDDNYDVTLGNVSITPLTMKSDTNVNFSVKQGASYTFKITGATSFTSGSSGVFKIDFVSKSGVDSFYKITAIGQPGQQTGLYMSAPGQVAQKICVVTVSPSLVMKSDTNVNFSVKQGGTYTFKISGATSFTSGSSGVFKIDFIQKSGADSYYRITAIGQPGQQTGLYMSAPGLAAQKVCVVTVDPAAQITIKSDTNYDFAIAKGASYQFKLTAPGAQTLSFSAGTSGVYQITPISHTGDNFFYKITAVGQSGKETGLYASVPGQPALKICKVAIK